MTSAKNRDGRPQRSPKRRAPQQRPTEQRPTKGRRQEGAGPGTAPCGETAEFSEKALLCPQNVALPENAPFPGKTQRPQHVSRAEASRGTASKAVLRPAPKIQNRLLGRLKKRADFLAIRSGPRRGTRGFLLQGRQRRADEQGPAQSARVGFTVTKKIGNAVARNRIRRRLREALRTTPGLAICAHGDYVIVARKAVLDMSFQELQRDLTLAFREITRQITKRPGAGSGQ